MDKEVYKKKGKSGKDEYTGGEIYDGNGRGQNDYEDYGHHIDRNGQYDDYEDYDQYDDYEDYGQYDDYEDYGQYHDDYNHYDVYRNDDFVPYNAKASRKTPFSHCDA
nr:putative eggshell protein [Penaeus vannamei]